MNVSDRLADQFTIQGIELEGLAQATAGQARAILSQLAEELERTINETLTADGGRSLSAITKRRVELLRVAKRTIDAAYTDLAAQQQRVEEIVATQVVPNMFSEAMTRAMGGAFIDWAIPVEQLDQFGGNVLIQGAPSRDWWARQSVRLRESFEDQMRLGYLSGESIDDLTRRIRGRATGKRKAYWDPKTGKRKTYVEFAGGIIDTGSRQAAALARTSVMTVAAEARRAMYRENADIIRGIQQVSTLDNRTTVICAAYSGASWDLDGNPINGTTLPYKSGVPRHWNCRSTEIPLTKSYRELGLDMDELPPGTRASMDGEVAQDLSFDEWLKRQPAAVQDEMLGAGRAGLWRSGKITLQDLVSDVGRPRTLAMLRQLSETVRVPKFATAAAAAEWLAKKYGKTIVISGVEILTTEAAQAIIDVLVRIDEEFGTSELPGRLMIVTDIGGKTLGDAEGRYRTIRINASFFGAGNEERFHQAFGRRGETVEQKVREVLTHEIGHLLKFRYDESERGKSPFERWLTRNKPKGDAVGTRPFMYRSKAEQADEVFAEAFGRAMWRDADALPDWYERFKSWFEKHHGVVNWGPR